MPTPSVTVNVIGTNQTELNTANGSRIFFSYNTPVAARTPDGDWVRSKSYRDGKTTNTTERHINKWLESNIGHTNVGVRPQSYFDTLL